MIDEGFMIKKLFLIVKSSSLHHLLVARNKSLQANKSLFTYSIFMCVFNFKNELNSRY